MLLDDHEAAAVMHGLLIGRETPFGRIQLMRVDRAIRAELGRTDERNRIGRTIAILDDVGIDNRDRLNRQVEETSRVQAANLVTGGTDGSELGSLVRIAGGHSATRDEVPTRGSLFDNVHVVPFF